MLDKDLKVFFSSASYSLLEGQSQVLVLEADKQFEVPFTIDVTLMDITAVGKCLVYMLKEVLCRVSIPARLC